MNIKEIREKRAKLVDEIQELLTKFYDETSVAVTGIRVSDEALIVVGFRERKNRETYLPRVFLEVRL